MKRSSQPAANDRAACVMAAKRANLRYVADDKPGIHRVRCGNGFRYISSRGHPIADQCTLDRIRQLAVSPAWSNVWICPSPTGHLQATGRDTKGRKQYRYHARWRDIRDGNKFDRHLFCRGFARDSSSRPARPQAAWPSP